MENIMYKRMSIRLRGISCSTLPNIFGQENEPLFITQKKAFWIPVRLKNQISIHLPAYKSCPITSITLTYGFIASTRVFVLTHTLEKIKNKRATNNASI